MKQMTEEQRRIAFANLMDETEYIHDIIVIDSPSTDAYKARRHMVNERVQQGVADYAEAYISSADFFID